MAAAVTPMLATLSDRREFDDGWRLERKLDGVRLLARREGGDVGLLTRTAHEATAVYPEVTEALGGQRSSAFVLDGEVVAFEGEASSFSRLQQRLGVAHPPAALVAEFPVVLCVFDLLALDGEDLRRKPLSERRARLAEVIAPARALQLTEAWPGSEARERFAAACAAGWEGLIAKRADAPYRAGRAKDWLKLKCAWEQEFVVGGWTDPAGSRVGLGALLVGYHEDGALRYAGKVGTGYDEPTLRRLVKLLEPREIDRSPFDAVKPVPKGVHWARPELVAQVGFAEWTTAGRLRQPRFLGLRDDKRPRDVVRERAR
jgi:bifunctional non-homologous end joining protein LigD